MLSRTMNILWPEDELVTVNGLSDKMRNWLDSQSWEELPDFRDNFFAAKQTGCEAFMRRYDLKPGGHSGFCQHAISRSVGCAPKRTEKWCSTCEEIWLRYPIDHIETFVLSSANRHRKRVDVIVGQPYTGSYSKRVDKYAEKALIDGLDLMVSARQSYYYPGRTALIAIARPGILVK